MRSLRLLLVALAVVTACDGDSPSEPGRLFTGTWIWVSSIGGIGGQERTPLTEGVAVRLDYDGRRARAFHDGALVAETGYSAEELPTAGPLPVYSIEYDTPLAAFPFAVLDEHTVQRVAPAVVRFVDPCCDRWTHILVDGGAEDQ